MKKLLMVAMVAIMALAFTACGGGGGDDGGDVDKTVTYAGWFTTEFPEGFTAYDENEKDFRRDLDSEGYDQDRFYVEVNEDPFYYSNQETWVTTYGYTKGEKEIGDYNWTYYTDGKSIRVYGLIEEKDDEQFVWIEILADMYVDANNTMDNEDIQQFLKTFKVTADDPYQANQDFLRGE